MFPWETKRENIHHYWHGIVTLLKFLDGLSPQEAKNTELPKLFQEFEQSDIAKNIKYMPEKDLVFAASIWETYGQRLFDIFDARNKDLWEQYSVFVSEYEKILPQI
jgi:hypothetical protein